jgi:hypothetical protein
LKANGNLDKQSFPEVDVLFEDSEESPTGKLLSKIEDEAVSHFVTNFRQFYVSGISSEVTDIQDYFLPFSYRHLIGKYCLSFLLLLNQLMESQTPPFLR